MVFADVGDDEVAEGVDDDGPDSMTEATTDAMIDSPMPCVEIGVADGVDDTDSKIGVPTPGPLGDVMAPADVGVAEGADDGGPDSMAEEISDAGAVTVVGSADVFVSGIVFTSSDDGQEYDEMSVSHTSSDHIDAVVLSENVVTTDDLAASAVHGVARPPEDTVS
jgi:hypothetical protein